MANGKGAGVKITLDTASIKQFQLDVKKAVDTIIDPKNLGKIDLSSIFTTIDFSDLNKSLADIKAQLQALNNTFNNVTVNSAHNLKNMTNQAKNLHATLKMVENFKGTKETDYDSLGISTTVSKDLKGNITDISEIINVRKVYDEIFALEKKILSLEYDSNKAKGEKLKAINDEKARLESLKKEYENILSIEQRYAYQNMYGDKLETESGKYNIKSAGDVDNSALKQQEAIYDQITNKLNYINKLKTLQIQLSGNNATQMQGLISVQETEVGQLKSKITDSKILADIQARQLEIAQNLHATRAQHNETQKITEENKAYQNVIRSINLITTLEKARARAGNEERAEIDSTLQIEKARLENQKKLVKNADHLANIATKEEQSARAVSQAEARKVDLDNKKVPGQFSFGDLTEWLLLRKGIQFAISSFKDGINSAIEFNKAITEISIVTGQSQREVQKLGLVYNEMAREMGVSTKEIARASVEFYRQGLSQAEVMERMTTTTQFSKVSNLEFTQSAEVLTATVNSMNITIERASDVFTYLGDATATGADEIGVAFQKLGKQNCPYVQKCA